MEYLDVLTSCSDEFKVDDSKIMQIADAICSCLGLKGWQLCIKFVDNEEIAYLNNLYRSKDYPTDVLSFPQVEWDKPLEFGGPTQPWDKKSPNILGDIVISLEQAQLSANNIGHGLDREVCFLLVHGILHLSGHDHIEKDEEAVMIAAQKQVMSLLETQEKSPIWLACAQK